jgi:hypothetical protein
MKRPALSTAERMKAYRARLANPNVSRNVSRNVTHSNSRQDYLVVTKTVTKTAASHCLVTPLTVLDPVKAPCPGPYVIPGQTAMGGSPSLQTVGDGLLIDWLTLRIPLELVGSVVADRVKSCMGSLICCNADGELKWQKKQLDVEKLRSDSKGLFWQAQGDGKTDYLVIAASPASLTSVVNVFGSLDARNCANVLRFAAMRALNAYLPEVDFWQCRRIDITGNYALPDAGSVKQALRQLLNTDGVRRRASSNARGGDTVYWCPTSDVKKGKAYHKGAHLRSLMRKGKLNESDLSEDQLVCADRLLRLEHTRGARWFRRFEQGGGKWIDLTAEALAFLYLDFFGPLLGGLEVKNMGREQLVSQIEKESKVSHQQALQAFTTFRNITVDGFEETKAGMAERTWFRHLKILRSAGFSDAELCAGNVVPFQAVKVLLAVPVASWAELRVA